MPRRRFRDPDPLVRDRNQLEILGAPGLAGLSRIGSRPGGGTSLVVRPPANGLGTQIEHVTLHAVDGQTIAAGGGTVQWDRIAGPPTEIRGFTTAADELASNGSVGAIPIDLTGELEVGPLLGEWATYRGGGTIQVLRTRQDVGQVGTTVEVAHEFEPGPIRSRFFDEEQTGVAVRAGDTIEVVTPNDVEAVLSWARLPLRIIGVASPTSLPDPEPLPTWVVTEVNGTGSSGATYETYTLTDNGDYTYYIRFQKVAGWDNIDQLQLERISDGSKSILYENFCTPPNLFPAPFAAGGGAGTEDWYHDPSSVFDGKTSHRLWATNGRTINYSADSYFEFTYQGDA